MIVHLGALGLAIKTIRVIGIDAAAIGALSVVNASDGVSVGEREGFQVAFALDNGDIGMGFIGRHDTIARHDGDQEGPSADGREEAWG